MTAIKYRNWEKVNDTKVNGDDRHQSEKHR